MHKEAITKRKTRALLQSLMIPVGIFLVTMLCCIAVFGYRYLMPLHVITPLGAGKGKMDADSAIAQVEDFCKNKKIECQSVFMSPEGVLTILMGNNEQILLSSDEQLGEELSSLQLTLNQLTIEGKQFKKLDFRFAKPVITF